MVQFMKPTGGGLMMVARPDDKVGDLVWRCDAEHFGANAQVVVGEREGVVFMSNGAVAGIVGAGRHTLSVQTFPFLQSLQDPSGGFRATVIFVSRMVRGVQFGGKINGLRDQQGGQGDVAVFGEYVLVVLDPGRLITQLTGADGDSKAATSWTSAQLTQHIEGCLTEWVSGGYYTIQTLGRATKPLTEAVPQHCANFAEYGLKLQSFSSITLSLQ
jgi:membrane protease subunit (stomatin/prohibitin family)